MRVQGCGMGMPASSDVGLSISPGLVGDACAIALSQSVASAETWQLDVYCHIDEGSFMVGTITTNPPANGDPPSRLVAVASIPGAKGWSVKPRGPLNAWIDIVLCATRVGPMSVPLQALQYGGQNAQGPRVWVDVGPLTFSQVFSTTARRAWQVYGASLNPAALARYVMLFDSATIPGNGARPTIGRAPLNANGTFSFDWKDRGRPLVNGLAIVVSSTPDALTIDNTATFDWHAEVQ